MQTIRLLASPVLSPDDLTVALSRLAAGEPIAMPTETVYGLAGDLFSETALASIFRIKGRPSDNPLIAHISSLSQLARLVESPDALLPLAQAFWPGPLTLVARRHPSLSASITAGLDSIAVRMPAHPAALQLIDAFGSPLAAPSANLSGKPSPTSVEDVLEDFDGRISLVIDGGRCRFGIESTVISLLGQRPVLLRPGAIARAPLEALLGAPLASPSQGGPVLSPGMKYRHYAPKARVILVHSPRELKQYAYAPPVTAETLYFHLRQADRLGFAEIAILIDDVVSQDEALMNRLLKAAGHR